MAVPSTISAVFFSAAIVRRSASSGTSPAGSGSDGVSSSSCSFLAAGMSGKEPLTARRASMPGISSRLISLVPSKMRFTMASRK